MITLLKGGSVYDGTGAVVNVLDILVSGDKIIEIGTDIKSKADRVIDCTGLCVAPGFIDAHSHNDFFVLSKQSQEYFAPFLRQGITSQVVGNCGKSAFGVDMNSPHVPVASGGLFPPPMSGSFTDFVRDSQGKLHLNIVPLIGHGTIRGGMVGMDPKHFTQEQNDEMITHIDEAMENGAFGGSFGIMYEPGMYADEEELLTFARALKKHDGILTIHPRACSSVSLAYRPMFTRPHIEIALNEVENFMVKTGVRTQYSHLIFVGEKTWKTYDTMVRRFREMQEAGHDIAFDIYAYTFGCSVITVILPPWYLGLSPEKRKSRFVRMRLKMLMKISMKLLGFGFEEILVQYISPKHKHYEGKTIAQIARDEGKSATDMYLELVELSNAEGRLLISKYSTDEMVLKLMQNPQSLLMTDAWWEEAGYQNTATYQGFPEFLVIAKRHNLPLERIIHKMTGATAARFKIPNRGTIAEGNFADITVFDYENVSTNLSVPDEAPKGIKYVLVNGQLVVDNEQYTPNLCGRMLTRA
ncbi:MAG: amidohydrolase family protein [Firmicutes bacterium]|nr:amidohydrolase family protein [Bacillota bacterium]